jgi:hypothetical protein
MPRYCPFPANAYHALCAMMCVMLQWARRFPKEQNATKAVANYGVG